MIRVISLNRPAPALTPKQEAAEELYEALELAKREIVASGNWGARDYKWPEVCEKVDAALAKAGRA